MIRMGMMLEVMMVHHSDGGGPPGEQVYMEVNKVDYEVANMEFDKVADVVVILMEMM